MFHLRIGNPAPQAARDRDETVLRWAVDCTPRIDRSHTAASHVAKTAASGSNGLTSQM